ncbi:MAG: hydrogenase expression/formation protein HypE [Glaciecola sp.]|jgi:hydrogenase expression/formation protein HypE
MGADIKIKTATITMSHGAGGKAMHKLIDEIMLSAFNSYSNGLVEQEDQARVDLAELQLMGNKLAFTTDSYVVDPLFFPGGDIGKLAVTGTINDLAVGGAKPLYLSCGFILEEGLPIDTLKKVVDSMQETASKAGVKIVTGDTKVVPKGACDKIFINTSGIGVISAKVNIQANRAESDDVVIVNGYVGDHGAAIVDARGELALDIDIQTDCEALHELVASMLSVCPDIHCMRDATRGGLITVLNEFAAASGCNIEVEESSIPVRDEVRGVCEILGLDPLYLANEGKLVAVIPNQYAQAVLEAMQTLPCGQHASVIGKVVASERSQVILNTRFGTRRIADVLVGDQLPRIC